VERSVAELYRLHARFVERVLRRAGVADRDLADARQEVFVVVHRRLGEFEGRASAQTWLYRIAWNVASEYRRRAHRRRELLDEVDERTDEGPSPDVCIETQRSVAALLDAIDRLDADKREALVCHELDEQPMIAVARQLKIPLKTAFSRLYAARRALRLDLRKQGLQCLPWWSWPFSRLGTGVRASRWLDPSCFLLPSRGLVALALVGLVPGQPAPFVEPPPPVIHRALSVEAAVAPVQLPPPAAHTSAGPRVLRDRPTARRSHVRAERSERSSRNPEQPRIELEDVTVVRAGRLDLGLGPFGESPLADPPLVEPQRHPRTKLPKLRRASD
jgi:RNA polymerase sigma-70 factor (ECF subfamily)